MCQKNECSQRSSLWTYRNSSDGTVGIFWFWTYPSKLSARVKVRHELLSFVMGVHFGEFILFNFSIFSGLTSLAAKNSSETAVEIFTSCQRKPLKTKNNRKSLKFFDTIQAFPFWSTWKTIKNWSNAYSQKSYFFILILENLMLKMVRFSKFRGLIENSFPVMRWFSSRVKK